MSGSRVKFLWVFCVLAFGVLHDASAPAHAQFFNFFGEGVRRPVPQRRYAPQYQYQAPQPYGYQDDGEDRWRQRYEQRNRIRMRERSEVSSDSQEVKQVAKDADAKNILVLGDQMADGLAQGLREAFAADAKANVKAAAKDGASLVGKRADSFMQFAKEKLASENPAAIVVMLGANERRDMEENGSTVDFQSERWRTLYLDREDALLQLLKDKHVPVYWVGLPAARSKELSGVMTYLNGLYQQKSYVRNAKYVDIWQGFVDEDGDYMGIGPDVNGNSRRLRLRDGMTLTGAGNRKLAFYVEKELRRDLALNQPAVTAAIAPAAATTEDMSKPIGNSYVGPVVPLNPAAAPENAVLNDNAPEATGTLQATVAKPGRSDDFTWPLEQRQALPPSKAEPKTELKSEQKAYRKRN